MIFDPMRYVRHLPLIYSIRLLCGLLRAAMLPGRLAAALVGGRATFTLKFEIAGQHYSLHGDHREVLADVRRIGEHRGVGP